MVDLTPAAIGPYCIPVINGQEYVSAPNVNMVTCGGQATIPIVYAVSRAVAMSAGVVPYAEIVASPRFHASLLAEVKAVTADSKSPQAKAAFP